MTILGWAFALAFLGLLLPVARPIGRWFQAPHEGRRTSFLAALSPMELGVYRVWAISALGLVTYLVAVLLRPEHF